MNELDEMKTRDAVLRDPEFSLRILWIRQVLLLVFLAGGIVMTCVLSISALGGDGHAGNILFPACWTLLVVMLLRGGRAKIKDMRREAIAQHNPGT